LAGGLRVLHQQVGRAVRRYHPHLVRHAELAQPGDGVLHRVPVGTGSHDYPDQRGGGGLVHGGRLRQNAILDGIPASGVSPPWTASCSTSCAARPAASPWPCLAKTSAPPSTPPSPPARSGAPTAAPSPARWPKA